MPKKLLLSIAAVAAAFGLASCGGDDEQPAEDAPQSQQQGDQAASEPELDNIPDVVAVVDGEEISGEAFAENYQSQYQQLSMQAQMTGQEPNQDQLKGQALEMMINSELLVMEAEDQGFSASDDEVEDYLSEMAEANDMESADELMEELEAQGLSEERIREDLHNQVMIDQVVQTLEVEEPSEDELQQIYDAQVEQLEAMNEQVDDEQAQEVPEFEEMKPELEEQAKREQENAALTALLDDLRDDTEIEVKL